MNSPKIKIIAIVLSLLIHLSFLFSMESKENFSDKEVVAQNSGRVVFNIPQKKELVKKQEVKKKKEKPKEDKLAKKKEKPKPQKEEKVAQKEQEIIEEKTMQKSTSNDNTLTKEAIAAKKDLFLSQIKERIDKNKVYPKTARRRGIEGEVHVKFVIDKTGKLLNIKILKGSEVFYGSAEDAIKSSFPIEVPKELVLEKFQFELTLSYNLV